MLPKLPLELQQALDARQGDAVRLVDERTGKEYILMSADLWERLFPEDDDEFDPRDFYPLMAEAVAELWDDPEMDVYDNYPEQRP
jgi:hypothetical protein